MFEQLLVMNFFVLSLKFKISKVQSINTFSTIADVILLSSCLVGHVIKNANEAVSGAYVTCLVGPNKEPISPE